MKTTFIVGALIASASASVFGRQATTTSAPETQVTRCLAACPVSDTTCRAACVAVSEPNSSIVSAGNNCAANCVQGDGSIAETQRYAACLNSCIVQFPAAGLTAPTAASSGGASSPASATGTGAVASGTSAVSSAISGASSAASSATAGASSRVSSAISGASTAVSGATSAVTSGGSSSAGASATPTGTSGGPSTTAGGAAASSSAPAAAANVQAPIIGAAGLFVALFAL